MMFRTKKNKVTWVRLAALWCAVLCVACGAEKGGQSQGGQPIAIEGDHAVSGCGGKPIGQSYSVEEASNCLQSACDVAGGRFDKENISCGCPAGYVFAVKDAARCYPLSFSAERVSQNMWSFRLISENSLNEGNISFLRVVSTDKTIESVMQTGLVRQNLEFKALPTFNHRVTADWSHDAPFTYTIDPFIYDWLQWPGYSSNGRELHDPLIYLYEPKTAHILTALSGPGEREMQLTLGSVFKERDYEDLGKAVLQVFERFKGEFIPTSVAHLPGAAGCFKRCVFEETFELTNGSSKAKLTWVATKVRAYDSGAPAYTVIKIQQKQGTQLSPIRALIQLNPAGEVSLLYWFGKPKVSEDRKTATVSAIAYDRNGRGERIYMPFEFEGLDMANFGIK